VELQPGSGGVYVITAAGQQIFSKRQEKRFPAPDEIITRLRQALA
jgi:selT/selW/selH-like putative selenoprotein